MPSVLFGKINLQRRQSVLDAFVPAETPYPPPITASSAVTSNNDTETPVRTIVALTITSVFIILAFGLFVVWQLHNYKIEQIKRHNRRKRSSQFRDQNLPKTSTSPRPKGDSDDDGAKKEREDPLDDTDHLTLHIPIRRPPKDTPHAQKETFPGMYFDKEQGRDRRQTDRGGLAQQEIYPGTIPYGHQERDRRQIHRGLAQQKTYPEILPRGYQGRDRRQTNRGGLAQQETYPEMIFDGQPRMGRRQNHRGGSRERRFQHTFAHAGGGNGHRNSPYSQHMGSYPQPNFFEQQPPGPSFPQRTYDSPHRMQQPRESGGLQYDSRSPMAPSWHNSRSGDPALRGPIRSRQHISPISFIPLYPAAPPPSPRSHRYHTATVEDDDSLGA